MGGGATAGGGRATRALRLLLLLVLALAAVEYLFGSILDASPLRTYLYTPLYNATQPTLRNAEKQLQASWSKAQPSASTHSPESNDTQVKNMTVINYNSTKTQNVTYKITNATLANNTSAKNGSAKNSAANNPSGKNSSAKDSSVKNSFTKNITAMTNITMQDIPMINSTQISPMMTKLLEGMKNIATTEEALKNVEPDLPLCEPNPPDLGPIPVNKTELELDFVEKKYPEVQWGGRYKPPNCTARHKVAIIVPYRDRQQHLAIFLNHMHPFLMKQQIEYGIFIVEQEGYKDFNRAKLMNVGFVESQKLEPGGWQCFIFHDIDLLPLDTRNMYSCPRQPRHMSASIDKLHFRLPYEDIFGGVSAVTREQFEKVNGFSNKYWGWGGEDDDMFYRLKKMNYHIARYKMSIARYAMLDHKKSAPNPKRYQLLSQTSKTFQKDGLSTLEYELIQVVRNHLYTYVLANIDERS